MAKTFLMFVVLGAALSTAGCKKKNDSGDAFAKMSGFADSMCACKDKACADKVTADMTKWSEEMAKKAGDKKAEPMSAEDTKKYADVTTKLGECTTKIMMAAAAPPAGSAAPPAGSATPPAGSAAPPAAPPAAPAETLVDIKDMQLDQPANQDASNFATARLWDDKSKNGEQYSLKIQDVRNRPYMIKEFETPPEGATKETVGAYPALVKKEMFGPELSVLVNKGGLVVSATTARGAAEKTIDELKKAVQMMDLAGLEKNDLKKPEIDGKTLAKYFPKLKAKK
jgi:hypothetical protein